jgi:hypothetical protein
VNGQLREAVEMVWGAKSINLRASHSVASNLLSFRSQ